MKPISETIYNCRDEQNSGFWSFSQLMIIDRIYKQTSKIHIGIEENVTGAEIWYSGSLY